MLDAKLLFYICKNLYYVNNTAKTKDILILVIS